jgi:hypothetical protein
MHHEAPKRAERMPCPKKYGDPIVATFPQETSKES